MSIYDEIAPAVAEAFKIAKQGQVFLITVTPGEGPIDEPDKPTEQQYELDAAARGAQYRYVQAGLADASDKQVTFYANPAIPNPTDKHWLLVDGVRYKVQRVIPKPAAGNPLAFTVFARR